MAKKEEKPDTIKQLFEYAGNYRYLTIASWVLATLSLHLYHFILYGD